MKKLIALLLALTMLTGLVACGASKPAETQAPAAETEAVVEAPTETEAPAPAEDSNELPRNETLYFAGQQWGTVNSWNVIGTNQNNAMAIAGGASGYRTLMFETLFMYNPLDGGLYGLLAEDGYTWNDTQTELTVNIKAAAKWSDGTPVTAADVKRTFDIGVEIGNGTGTGNKAYISEIVADGNTVTLKAALNDEGKAVNPLKLLDFLTGTPIAQAAWIDTVVARCGGDATAILNDAGEDVV